MLIDEFNLEEFPKVKRFGLPIFSKDTLKQYYDYLNGLYSFNVSRKPELDGRGRTTVIGPLNPRAGSSPRPML